MNNIEETQNTVKVWDLFVRVFHWALVILFVVAWVSEDSGADIHRTSGYIIAALVAMRVVWGIIGSKHAKFSEFLYKPSVVVEFLKDSIFLKAKRYLGHNPAGGAMVVALLVVITGIVVSGHMMTMDKYWGEEWIEEVHEFFVNSSLVLIAVHIIGVAVASLEHKENLPKAMVSGRKRIH